MKGWLVFGGAMAVLVAVVSARVFSRTPTTTNPATSSANNQAPSTPTTPSINNQTPLQPTTPTQTDDPRYQNPGQPMTQRHGPEWYSALKQRILGHCWKSRGGRDKALRILEDDTPVVKPRQCFVNFYASTLSDLANFDRIEFISEYKERADELVSEFLWGPVRQVAWLNRNSDYFAPDSKVASQVEDILVRMRKAELPLPATFWGVINPDTPKEPSLSVAVSLLRSAGVEVLPEDAVIGEKNWARRNEVLTTQAIRLWEVAQCN